MFCIKSDTRNNSFLDGSNLSVYDAFTYNIPHIKDILRLLKEISYISFDPIRTARNFAPFWDPLTVKYIEMFHADFSYKSIYEQNIQKKLIFLGRKLLSAP